MPEYVASSIHILSFLITYAIPYEYVLPLILLLFGCCMQFSNTSLQQYVRETYSGKSV